MLTKVYLKKGDGFNQTEIVEKRVIKIEEICLSTGEFIQALDRRGKLNDLEKGNLVKLMVTLSRFARYCESVRIPI